MTFRSSVYNWAGLSTCPNTEFVQLDQSKHYRSRGDAAGLEAAHRALTSNRSGWTLEISRAMVGIGTAMRNMAQHIFLRATLEIMSH